MRTRLQALWLLRAGWTVQATAAAVGVHYRTVQRWLGDYRDGGGGTGQPRRLTPEQEAALEAHAATGALRTASAAGRWIEEQFGVTYAAGGIYSLLARLRIRPKVPRPVNPKADPAAQAAWQKGGSRRRSPARA